MQCAVKDGVIYKDGAAAFNLQAYLEQKYSVPAVVEKEINLACFGEICGHEMQFLDDEYTTCLRLSNSGVQCSLVYKTNVLTGFQGKAGASATANLIGNTKAGQEEAVLRAIKAVNSFFNPKTIIIYKDNADKAEAENLKSCEAQNIVFVPPTTSAPISHSTTGPKFSVVSKLQHLRLRTYTGKCSHAIGCTL